MAVNELSVTVVGLVGSDPVCYRGADGQVPFTRFRVASTPRVYDREHDAYVDGGTSWFTVKAFRQLALNVAECVRRGEPVVVHGRLRLVDWATPEGQQRTTGEITAESVGYDMNRGTARFTRTVHGPPAGDATGPEATGPAPAGQEVAGPEDADPEAAGPEAAGLGAGRPGAEALAGVGPGTGEPGAGVPGAGGRGAGGSRAGTGGRGRGAPDPPVDVSQALVLDDEDPGDRVPEPRIA